MNKTKPILPLFSLTVKRSIICFIVCFVLLLVSLSCEKRVGKLPPALTACDTTKYSNVIKPILDNKCISCHNDSPGSEGGFPLTNYGQVKEKADAGKIKARVIDQLPTPMPPSGSPGLTQQERDQINCWLGNGAKE
jgi:uncharacterized membrane protein